MFEFRGVVGTKLNQDQIDLKVKDMKIDQTPKKVWDKQSLKLKS